jgi:anti-anti-sigma factor
MLNATVQIIRDTTIVRCQGRMIVGENFAVLRNAVMSHSSTNLVVLDLAGVRRVDAGGLGMLLGLREWAEDSSIGFKLMNVMPKVQRILKLTKLDRVFEFWSVRDMFDVLCHAYLEGRATPDFRTESNAMVLEPPAA